MSEYDDWKQENDRWEAYLYPNGVLRNKLGNYLRTRGEYIALGPSFGGILELPPRTRRIHHLGFCPNLEMGTTSAYAENTHACTIAGSSAGNYLRVRGEYACAMASAMRRVELPPRTRRIPATASTKVRPPGTTSAYAENTYRALLSPGRRWNYLRVRGEYHLLVYYTNFGVELPPRTRRIQPPAALWIISMGTTSAYAENTAENPPSGV